MNDSIYKIFQPDEWDGFQANGVFAGSAHDQRDGFIHLCAAHQLTGTLAKHYTNIDTIILARFDAHQCAGVKWEVSRGGEEFPHIYGALSIKALQDNQRVHANQHGTFTIPTDF